MLLKKVEECLLTFKIRVAIIGRKCCSSVLFDDWFSILDETGYSVFPLSPVEVLWILVVTSTFPAIGLAQNAASDDILEKPPNNTIFTWEVIIDMFAYGVIMAATCLLSFVIVVYGAGNGDLGIDCNATNADKDLCSLVFEGRSTAFASMTWQALILAWECLDPKVSFIYSFQ